MAKPSPRNCSSVSSVLAGGKRPKIRQQRTVAALADAHRVAAVRAYILEAAQLGAESLHEDRARRERGREPVAVVGEVDGEAEERPDAGQAVLFMLEGIGIDDAS